jgi:hypothetical protein
MFDGLEQNDREIQRDPVLPLNDPGMKLCVNVLCAGRPNYLYVSLDSIFRNTAFGNENKPDVYLYVDVLANGDSYAKQMLEVAGCFPLRAVFINESHKGTVANYWYSFQQAFDMGYDYCILVEEDWLITTDAIQWLYDCPKIASLYSFYRWVDRIGTDPRGESTLLKYGEYFGWCVGFSKESFEFIYKIIKVGTLGLYGDIATGEYPQVDVGGPHPLPLSEVQRINYIDWDRTLTVIFRHYKLCALVPPVSLLAHFGCRTSNFMGYGSGVNRHEEMFAGPPEHWLDNVVALFNSVDDDEKTFLHFYPLTFLYR